MDIKIDQQVALDEALVPHNTQQYGVILPVELTNEAIRNSEYYKEYYVIASGAEPPKTKESARKKQSSSDTTEPPPTRGKRLKISAKVDKPAKEKQPAKSSTQFDEQPFEEEILAFLRELGHSGEIKMIIDVNINRLHQPWRSFAAVINKCLSGKSTGYDSVRLSQAQIL
uniref:Uncharacterized protein n=1 Tax=Tanacetum cinerariifolium TaxID=118510 RepID=A0A699KX89_TANCI|nr:hypothetical protein [Tanacetum cinerariifolium]